MANLLGFFCLVIGIYYSNCNPLPASALVEYPKQKEIKPESELRFGYGMSFQYHGQMLHGLNRYNLLVGLEIPDLRIPEYYTPGQDMYNSQFCEGNNEPGTQVWYKTCTNIWPAVQTAIRKVHDLRYDIKQIYQEELPAIIPNYKIGPMKKPQELNTSPVVSRKKRFITDIIGLGIQAFSAISQHRKQNKLEKSMKHLKHRQNVLDHKIEALEDDMISITKETFEELDYLRRELELTGYNIKVLTTKIKRVEYELSLQAERVIDNSNSILFLSGTISVLLSEMERYLALHERVKSELDHVLDALDNLSNNLLSHSVIRPSILKRLIKHVKQQLAEKYSNYELVITEVHDYYNIPVSSFDYLDGILGVFVPLFIRPRLQEPMYIYNVRTIPVPYHINADMVDETESENAYTHIIPDTEMVAMNRDTYINVDQSELKQCIKFSVMYFCEQTFLMKHTREHTCETAIYHEQNPDLIKDKCNIQYYPELNPTPQILDAGKHILLGNIPEPWSVVCSKNDPIPNPLEASKYVIIKKKDLCQCSLSAGTWYIQENIVHCEDEASSDLQLYYTINMAVMIYDFIKEIEEDEVRDISLYTEPVKYDPVEINLVDVKTEKVIGETYERLAFKRVMKNREDRLYANKIDYLMDTNDASDVFSGHNKYQTIFFIVMIIFVIILIVCLFGKFLGLNSHFQKILATINKITASIKTLLPAALPTTVRAATFTHGDVSLNINYFEILLYAIQIIIVMGVLYIIFGFIEKIWNCINTRNLGKLKEKLSFRKFLYIDKTELYIQLMSNHMTSSIYLGSVYDNPEGIVAEGDFQNGDLILYRGWVFDFLTIQWDNISLSQYDLDLWLPSSLPVPLTSKFFLRKLFDSPNTLFRIIAYNPQNGKVRPITSTYKLYLPMMSTCQYFQEEEVVSSDARNADLETTPSAPNGEVISVEHPSRIINSVNHDEDVPDLISDDEIPDLVSKPDIANDDKEAQELKADQDFDRDTKVAIQQSLDLCTGYGQLRGNHNSKTDK